jgi:C4-dicarboxylate-specific signal transduction histidine kinase/CheY-like chemotaxis protein
MSSAAGRRHAGPPAAELRVGAVDVGRLMDRMADAAILLDLSARAIVRANARFRMLCGIGPDEVSVIDLGVLHEIKDLEWVMRCASSPHLDGSVLPSVTCVGKDGAHFKADVRVTRLEEGAGTLILVTYATAPAAASGAAAAPAEATKASGPAASSLTTFTRRLAEVQDRESLGRVLVTAAAGLMGAGAWLLLQRRGAPLTTEILASSGLQGDALEAARRALDHVLDNVILSATRPLVIERLPADGEALEAGREELATVGIKAFVILPLESEERVVGAWAIGFPEAVRARGCDLETGQVFAAHLAGTLAGVLLLERTRREKVHHEVLNRIISWLRGAFDLQGVLNSVTEELCKAVEADRASILLADPADHDISTLRVDFEYVRPGQLSGKSLGSMPFAETALGEAILYSKGTFAVEDLRVRPDLTEHHEEIVRNLDLRGLITAKILSRQEFVGLVSVSTTGRPRAWTAEEIELVRAVADHVSVAIETGRLMRANEERTQQLDRERREWERTFDAIPDMLAVHDGYGRLLRANLALQVRMAGDPRGFIGKECTEILDVIMGRSSGCPHDEALKTRRAIAREIQGEHGAFALTAIPCFDAAGNCLYIIHVCREITEEKKIREQLLQTEKMAAVGNLVSGVAHELNNPLAGVIGFSEILLEKQEDAKTKKTLERIRDEAQRAAKIVKNLLTFARKHKPEAVMADINGVLERTLELRAYDLRVNKIKVTTDLSRDLPMTLVDPNQLLQVFMNVITNAEQAMREANGKGTLKITSSVAGPSIRMVIQDDGPGIKPDHLKQIFDPFFTTKPVGRGTGLGLSICHGIMKEHGGTIGATSIVGQGTTFVIELPVTRGTAAPARALRAAAPPAAAATILVVDDEESIRELVKDALSARGHQVDGADSGENALLALAKRPYDLVVSDLKMPEMSGQELYAKLLADHPRLAERVIFTSGDTVSAETQSFLEKPGRPYLLKPFQVQDLVDEVEKILRPKG